MIIFQLFSGCISKNRIELVVDDKKVKTYSSIEEAIEASRNYSAENAKTIVLAEGKYFLKKPILLTAKDKGLTIQSNSTEKAQIYGGMKITGWVNGDDGFWVADLSKIRSEDWFFRSLLVNGRYANRARYPEEGKLKHITKWTKNWLSTLEGGWEEEPSHEDLTKFEFKEGDIGEWLEHDNAEITVYHNWDETLAGIESIDIKNNILTTSIEVGHPMGAFGVRDYVIWNTRTGMTRPGQWYIDRSKEQLIYWPLPGENMKNIEIIAPVLEKVIQIENTSQITIQNIALHSTTTPLMIGNFAAKMFDGAVTLKESNRCTFDNISISGSTGWGIKAFGDSITIKNCELNNLGAGGIRLIGSNSQIHNNYIHHIGITYPSAIALYVGVTDPNMEDEWNYGKEKHDVIISHNEIHDCPYIGIGLGGADHTVEYNKIYQVMQDLADGSGLYGTFCKNLVVRNNLIKDITGGEHGHISSYYLDELSDNALIENNISLNVSRPSHSHLSKNNIIRGNIFISDGPMNITTPRCDSFIFENNIFRSGESLTIYRNESITIRDNLFDVKNDRILESIYIGRYKKGTPGAMEIKNRNIVARAQLTISNDNISFKENSPAKEMDIKPINGSATGYLSKID